MTNKIDVMVNASELGRWLGLGVPAVAAYARKGVVVRGAVRGQYDLRKSVGGYISHMRSSAAGREDDLTSKERARLLSAQASAAEAKVKKLTDAHVNAAKMKQRLKEMSARVLKILGDIPEEVGRRLPHLTPHDLGEIASEVELATAPLKDDKPKNG
jgi:phage terminase Nu1 subunit (DNA packaging protein)